MQAFAYDQPASRVIFGVGALERLREEIERLGVKRPLFICTPGRRKNAHQAAQRLTAMPAEAVMHVLRNTLVDFVKPSPGAPRHPLPELPEWGAIQSGTEFRKVAIAEL